MTLEIFRECLKLDEYISIGGGEPTLHPHFWQFLGESIVQCEFTWLATNGSQTKISLALAKLAQKGVIGCALSQDEWHDPIEEEVVEAFTRDKRKNFSTYQDSNQDYREIRDVWGKEVKTGRCDWGQEGCVCKELIVKPNGDIFQCGCADAPLLGNILTTWTQPEESGCHKQKGGN
jgi:MoaA/NifB/PqqE/SkfB family radical SAM enzyme